jgi:hypothetical protein
MRDIAEPRAIHRFSNQGGGVSPLVQLLSLLGKSTLSMGVVARAAGAGAVVIGFALGASSAHDASLTLQTVAVSRATLPANLCPDDPTDPSCPPTGPNDVKCAGAWRYTAACVGGPFDPNNSINCTPGFPGCPGIVPTNPPPPPLPPSKDHDPPPPPKHHEPPPPPSVTDHPGPPPGGDHPGGPGEPPPPGGDHSGPGTPGAPPRSNDPVPPPAVQAPALPVAPAPAVEAPHAAIAPVAPAPVIQAPIAPAAPAPVMAPSPVPAPSSGTSK